MASLRARSTLFALGLLLVAVYAALSAALPAIVRAEGTYDKGTSSAHVEHNDHCVSTKSGGSVVLRDFLGAPLKRRVDGSTITDPRAAMGDGEPEPCSTHGGIEFEGLERVGPREDPMYYTVPEKPELTGQSHGFVKGTELSWAPPVNLAYAHGNGADAPLMSPMRAYKIAPLQINGQQGYIGKKDSHWHTFSVYGLPTTGNPNYTLMAWSWVDVYGGGIGRAALSEGMRFYPAEVPPIRMETVSPEGAGNGEVWARYGEVTGPAEQIFGWVLISDTFAGQCHEQLIEETGPRISGLCPPPKPAAATSVPALTLGDKEALVNGGVNPEGSPATYTVKFSGPGGTASSTSLPAGTSEVPATVTLSNLQPLTTYHYRLTASGVGGEGTSNESEFTTLPLPPEVLAEEATNILPKSAVLHANVNPEGAPGETWYEIGTTTGYGTKGPIKSVGQWAIYNGVTVRAPLAPNTTYHYRWAARNAGGTTYGPDREFHTPYYPEVQLTIPHVTATGATLTGTIDPDGSSTSYQFRYWPAGHNAEAINVPASPENIGAGNKVAVSKTLTGLSEGVTYEYELLASNAGGNGLEEIQAVTPSVPMVYRPVSLPLAGQGVNRTEEGRLVAVSCASATLCFAVAQHEKFFEGQGPATIARWDGQGWSTEEPPAPAGGGVVEKVRLSGVSCTGPSWCMATGSYEKAPYVATWNGSSWSASKPAELTAEGRVAMQAVSCVSATFCMAVREYEAPAKNPNLEMFEWDGSHWTAAGGPAPRAGRALGLSCANTSFCSTAYTFGFNAVPRLEFSAWQAGATLFSNRYSDPEQSGLDWFKSISCTSATACVTVGEAKQGEGETSESSEGGGLSAEESAQRGESEALVGVWDGSSWVFNALPQPPGGTKASFSSVSCTSATSCTAVGKYWVLPLHSKIWWVPLVEHWDGSSWSVKSASYPPSHPGLSPLTTRARLSGVSCTSTPACIAVGNYETNSPNQREYERPKYPLAEAPEPPVNIVAPAISPSQPVQGSPERAQRGAWENNPETYEYQWERCPPTPASCSPIAGATEETYVPTEQDAEVQLRVTVTATDPGGSTTASSPIEMTVQPFVRANSKPIAEVAAPTQVSGTGAKLQGSVNPSGLETTYRFEYGPSTSYGSAVPATAASVGSGKTLVAVSQLITGLTPEATYHYRVVASNERGEVHSEDQTFIARPGRPTVVSPPVVSGTVQQGHTLTAGGDSWTESPTEFTYHWFRCTGSPRECTPILGATSRTYTLGAGDVFTGIEVEEVASNASGSSAPSVSAQVSFVQPPGPANSKAPSIFGPAAVGDVEEAENGNWEDEPLKYEYQWQRCNTSGGACVAILGATSATYTPVKEDLGHTLIVKVTAINSAGSTVALSSATAQVQSSLFEQCAGPGISGQGASVEKLAQTAWTAGFSSSTNKLACNGTQGSKGKPAIAYTAASSGAGLASWGVGAPGPEGGSFGTTNALIGTTEAPSAGQEQEILSHETSSREGSLVTVPVAQFALAIYVNLPLGCSATSTAASGRLVLSDATLAAIYSGAITKWGQIADGGDTLTGPGCSGDSIVPVVRREQAGTTDVLKKYLGLIQTTTLETASGPQTWDQLAQGAANTQWPSALVTTSSAAAGDRSEAETVAATPGSIGYSNLAELRATGSFSPATTGRFWVELQNGVKGKGESATPTYTDPATNGDVAAAAAANCAKTVYSNGAEPFPPSVTSSWSEVTTSVPTAPVPLKEKGYALCNLAYVVASAEYHRFPGTSIGEATTVNNFLQYLVEGKAGGGQALIGSGHDYAKLPKGAVANAAIEGARNVRY